ncbi:MAG: hypothetical protein K2J60_01985 [Acetatifactor sp.]|nr:hypothetical protein [Acetatifactor sp.]
MKSTKKRRRNLILCGVAVVITVYLWLCFSMRLTVRDTSLVKGDCMLYYIVNADGMKGLGHSILLIVDGEGCGRVFSFNGMQRSLGENLLGKSGVGKMSVGVMMAEETTAFLQTGDLNLDGDQLTDNYDMALYRPITTEEFHVILERLTPYIAAQEQYLTLHEKWEAEEDTGKKADYKQALNQLGQDKSLPLYQIYTNNCDHAARILASSVDLDLRDYTHHAWRLTPNGNFKAFGRKAKDWGVMTLGEQSLAEQILMLLIIF